MAMFEDPIAPKSNPAAKRVGEPFKPQPSYEQKKQMFAGGDYYGTGFKAKVGKIRGESGSMSPIPQKSLRKAPESLA